MIKKVNNKSSSKWFAHCSSNEQAKINLLCFVFAGGSPAFFATWKKQFPSWINVMPVLYPQREKRMSETMPKIMSELVSNFLNENEALLKKPYAIWGHCSGALIGLEIAKETSKLGNDVKAFIVSGCEAPEYALFRLQGGEKKRSISDISDEGILADLNKFNLMDEKMLENKTFKNYFLPIYRADLEMLCSYDIPTKTKLNCSGLIINGSDDKMVKSECILEWEKYFKRGSSFESYSGEHYFVNDHVNEITDRISKFLEDKFETKERRC